MPTEQNVPTLRAESDSELLLSEVIAALSYALDLTGGQPEGHAGANQARCARVKATYQYL